MVQAWGDYSKLRDSMEFPKTQRALFSPLCSEALRAAGECLLDLEGGGWADWRLDSSPVAAID